MGDGICGAEVGLGGVVRLREGDGICGGEVGLDGGGVGLRGGDGLHLGGVALRDFAEEVRERLGEEGVDIVGEFKVTRGSGDEESLL